MPDHKPRRSVAELIEGYFAELPRHARRIKNKKHLSLRLGKNAAYIAQVTTDKIEAPPRDVLLAIAQYFGKDPKELFEAAGYLVTEAGVLPGEPDPALKRLIELYKMMTPERRADVVAMLEGLAQRPLVVAV